MDAHTLDARRLETDALAVVVVPESGGRVASLVSRRTGREWLWRPREELKVWRNAPGDAFSQSPLTGLDECLPTISPCVIEGRRFGDHGDAWTQAWEVLEEGPQRLALRVRLPGGGLALTRTLEAQGGEIRFDYRLENTGTLDEPWLWCWHPLFRFDHGDWCELPAGVKRVRVSSAHQVAGANPGEDIAWPHPCPGVDLARLDWGPAAPGSLKAFVVDAPAGYAALHAGSSAERLEIHFDPARTPHLGVWLTDRAWNGYRHVALEPCTAPVDNLASLQPLPRLRPRETAEWWVRLALVPEGADEMAPRDLQPH